MASAGAIEFKLVPSADDWILQTSGRPPFTLETKMVVGRGFGPYISIYRPEEFEQISNAFLTPHSPFSDDARNMRRRFHGGAFDVALDSAGRLPIPRNLVKACNGLDASSNQPLAVVAFPEHFSWAPCGHWALWAKERRWEALELMHKREQRQSKREIVAVRGLYLELAEELSRNPVDFYRLKPRLFEELCAELMAHQGFEIELSPETGDGGVDLYAVKHTAFGRRLLVVDCKRYRPDRPVGVGVVRGMLGAIDINRANAGVVISTSRFSAPAVTLADEYPFRIDLKDYFDLQRLLAEFTEEDSSPPWSVPKP